MIIIESTKALKEIAEINPDKSPLPESSYDKTRFIGHREFDAMIEYVLSYEPYIKIAERCGMDRFNILQSPVTNRFYIGFINIGGHAPRCEVRPVRLKEIAYADYMLSMFENQGQKLDWGLDLNENYEV
jgi:hypothetical protein